LREQITEQVRGEALLAAAARNAETQAREYIVKWRDEERLRLAAEAELRDVRAELARGKAETRSLQNLVAEHSALLDELGTARHELKSERRKVRRLEKELNRRTGKEGYFGLATPSSLKINKPNATAANQAKKGGAKRGHEGHGRKDFTEAEADEVIRIEGAPSPCTCGQGFWMPGDLCEHCVIERIPERKNRRFFLKQEHICSACGRIETMKTPDVVPGGLYGNALVAHLIAEHYLHGLTAGNVCRREGVNEGMFFHAANRCAGLLEPVFRRILLMLRNCLVVHADETGWRNDGSRAYGWIFANHELAAFLFRQTRGGKVPLEVFGEDPLDVNLVTDRYRGYDPLKVNRQYCYTHLLRDIKKLEKDFPDEPEIAAFAAELKPLLKDAIAMYRRNMELADYVAAATAIKDRIVAVCGREANHPGIQHLQNIFREHPDRVFQWVKSPEIPAENNFAERGLRPQVIARKISFGSQSSRGMRTREILMTFLYTARVRGLDPRETLRKALNLLCRDPAADIAPLLGFPAEPQMKKRAA